MSDFCEYPDCDNPLNPVDMLIGKMDSDGVTQTTMMVCLECWDTISEKSSPMIEGGE